MKLVWVYLLFAGISFLAYGRSTSSQATNANLPFTLTIGFNHDSHSPNETAARTVKAGSPLTLRIRETNISDHEIPKLPVSNLPSYGVFEILDGNGHPAAPHKRTGKWITGGGPGFAPGKGMLLRPGESIIDFVPVGSWFDLNPGTYTIQVSQHISNDPASEVVKSNIVKITVVPREPPAGEPK